MPPTSDKDGFRWRIEGVYRTVTGEAFAKLVAENDLKVEGPFQGYFYAKLKAEDGWELYRTLSGHKWIYQASRIATQANVAGGAVKVDIAIATGQYARIVTARLENSGTNGAGIVIRDEDNVQYGPLASVGSGAATNAQIPSIGTASSATNSIIQSHGIIIPSGANLTFEQTGAGAQNDTMRVAVILELYNLSTLPTWSTARSTNFADVTLAASTISTANTLQEVLC